MKRYEALRHERSVTLRYTFVLRKQGDRYEAYSTSEALRYVTLHFCFEIN